MAIRFGLVTPKTINLVTTPCRFGGARYWLECSFCARAVIALYLAPDDTGQEQFQCRHCAHLIYATQRATPNRRALHKAVKLRCKLGGSTNFLEPITGIPRYMHEKTFQRLMAKAQAIQETATQEIHRLTDAVAFAAGYVRRGNKLIRPRPGSTRR